MARGDGAGLQDPDGRQFVRLLVIPLICSCPASSVDQGYETRTRKVSANSCSARHVLSRFDNRHKHPELSQINERYGTRPDSPFDFGACSPFLGSLGGGLCSASCYMDFPHIFRLDSKNNCSHQSPRCCGTCNCLARSILFRGETFNPYPTTINTWYRSCMCLSIFARANYSNFLIE